MSQHAEDFTLLCVEDNKTTQLIYEYTLKDKVKEIIFASDGQEGFEKYKSHDIDIVMSDYEMPVLNGLEMIEKIREIDQDIPVILISAIDDVEVIVKALHFGVNNFVKKPLEAEDILEALKSASKLLIANKILQEQRDEKLNKLEQKHTYTSAQEDLAFAKELNILRNDFYYQMVDGESIALIDFLYLPLDVVSGDAYSARRVDHYRTFYLIVDGMGKGLSASLTAMIMTSFVNHLIDKMLEFESFSFEILIKEAMGYIKPILLDEEALAIDFILFDNHFNALQYSKFAMPAFLLETKESEIIKIPSNNPPLSKWQEDFKVDEYNISNVDKFLFYSDGIVENGVKNSNEAYTQYIEEDFKNSFTREEIKSKVLSKITEQEDDLTLIFINKFSVSGSLLEQKVFESSLADIDKADEWYTQLWEQITDDMKLSYAANLTFTELFMNAFEHGNLGINTKQKHRLLEEDKYFEYLQSAEKECDKQITVSVHKIQNQASSYIITRISDEGEGFDTQILSEIFRNSQKFNGRGVFVSRKNSMGIYYNTEGNSVLFLNKI
jgi:YesN/AraC family two-component response regulator